MAVHSSRTVQNPPPNPQTPQEGNTTSLKSLDFVLFSPDIYRAWIAAAEELIPAPAGPEDTCAAGAGGGGGAANGIGNGGERSGDESEGEGKS